MAPRISSTWKYQGGGVASHFYHASQFSWQVSVGRGSRLTSRRTLFNGKSWREGGGMHRTFIMLHIFLASTFGAAVASHLLFTISLWAACTALVSYRTLFTISLSEGASCITLPSCCTFFVARMYGVHRDFIKLHMFSKQISMG